MIRDTFRLASRRDWDRLKRGLRPIYTAPNEAAAKAALDDVADNWGARYPANSSWCQEVVELPWTRRAIIRLWTNVGRVHPLPRQGSGDQYRHFIAACSVGKAAAGLHRPAVAGIQALSRIRAANDLVDLHVVVCTRPGNAGTMDHEVEPALNAFATTLAVRWPAAEP